MWKLLLLAVLANAFFLSLGMDDSESDESGEGKYWLKKHHNYPTKDSDENEDTYNEENHKIDYIYKYHNGKYDKYFKNKHWPNKHYNYHKKGSEENEDTYVKQNHKTDYADKYQNGKYDKYFKKISDKYHDGSYEENYEEEKSDNYHTECNSHYPEKCSERIFCEHRQSDAKCGNALEKFNKAVVRAGMFMLKRYVDSSPPAPGAIAPYLTLVLLSTLALYGEGETKAEVYKLLNLSNRHEIECAFCRLASVFHNFPRDVEFVGASDIFSDHKYQFTDEFKDDLLNIIRGAAVNVDFSNAELTANVVNGQIELETRERIQNFIKDISIFNSSTELVGLTATYFSSPWETEFEISKKTTEFCIAPGKSLPGKFYTQTSIYDYAYSKELKSQACRLYYYERSFNLLIVLPDEPFTENEVLDIMIKDPQGWYDRLTASLRPTKVHITMPAYDQENFVDTRALLIENGFLETIYSAETIQLKGAIVDDIPAGLSIGLQKHHIRIPPDGQYPPKKSSKGEAVEFLANRPYLWFICTTSVDTPLYMGYTNRPTTGNCN